MADFFQITPIYVSGQLKFYWHVLPTICKQPCSYFLDHCHTQYIYTYTLFTLVPKQSCHNVHSKPVATSVISTCAPAQFQVLLRMYRIVLILCQRNDEGHDPKHVDWSGSDTNHIILHIVN